ncbi:MAG: glycosyltransferase family 4 protein, partial [Candidatus Jacksonbacteria bacterium]|nr:glycosyltransferase family 4 protein [Candidatus Jacksonbacteria bacterium]MBT7008785.1 glycosyltransferase family 4 protein [Candidatus Jacksonbacteria bacterium]
ENCPLSILEAYAQATPVIASDIGGIPELVNDGETGYLIPANDTESIKAAAIQLMEMSEEDYEIMKQKSFKKAQEEYTEELHYRRLIDIYNHVK